MLYNIQLINNTTSQMIFLKIYSIEGNFQKYLTTAMVQAELFRVITRQTERTGWHQEMEYVSLSSAEKLIYS